MATINDAITAPNMQLVGFISRDGKFMEKERFEKMKMAMGASVKPEEIMPSQLSSNVEDPILASKMIEPPYSLDALRATLRISTVHYRCVRAKATDTVSEYKLRLRDKAVASVAEEEIATQFLLNCADPPDSFADLMEQGLTDYETVGFMSWEVGRDPVTGLVTKMWHVPAHTLRLTKFNVIVQIRGQKRRFFLPFPSKLAQLPKQGQMASWRLLNRDTGAYEQGLRPDVAANEILIIHNYHPLSERYGLPDYITATPAMLGNLMARDFNLNRFTNWMVPSYAVLVTGGTVDEPLRKLIEKYFEDLKGSSRDTLVLGLPGKDAKIEFRKLEADVEEASFATYMKDNRDEVLLAHGVHPARIGIIENATLGGGSGMSQLTHYKTAVIAPRQRKLSRLFSDLVFPRGMGVTNYELFFEPVDITDRKSQEEVLSGYIRSGVITRDEARQELGKPPLTEEQKKEIIAALQQARGNAAPSTGMAGGQEVPKSQDPLTIEVPEGTLETTKALADRDKTDVARAKLTKDFQRVWGSTPLPSGISDEQLQQTKSHLRSSLLALGLSAASTMLQERIDEAAAEYGVSVDASSTEEEISKLFHEYVQDTWLADLETKVKEASSLPTEERASALDKIKNLLGSRSALYAGLLATVSALVMRSVAKSTGRKVNWHTLGETACTDCRDIESQNPWDADKLPTLPGSGRTKCHGNCRCVLRVHS